MTTVSRQTRDEVAEGGVAVEVTERLHVAMTAEAQVRRYTLHLDFTTDDADKAMIVAAALADGLAVLRPEVDGYTASLSVPGGPNDPQPLFCAVTGPEGAVCGDLNGHPGWHSEVGVNGLRWGDGDGDGTRG
jgi:hypothetical protein